MSRFHNIDGVDVPYTAAEETARDAEEAEFVAAEPARKWARIRAQRDALLSSTDWRAMPDAPTMSDAWTTYRQALRDITTQDDPDDITWPTEP